MYYSGLHRAIKDLEEKLFYDVSRLFLDAKGYPNPIIVDGPGDGGRDVMCDWDTIRIQLSVQKDWKTKINKEAKATHESGKSHFVYVTNRRIRAIEIDDYIQKDYKFKGLVEVTVFDLDNIATALAVPGVMQKAYEILGILSSDQIRATPKEIALSNILLFSNEARELKENIIEATVKSVLLEKPNIPDVEILQSCLSAGLGRTSEVLIRKSMDRLRSTGEIKFNNSRFSLSEEAFEKMTASKRDFQASKLSDITMLTTRYGITSDQANKLIDLTVEIKARNGYMDGGDAYEIRLLDAISDFGLSRKKQVLFDDLATLASSRLAQHGAAIEHIFNTDTFDIYRALGRNTSISVILDSSVAMPMLFGLCFTRARSRYGIGASALNNICSAHNFNVLVPRVYLNEMASHGIKALEHIAIYSIIGDESRSVLKSSGNAYISHYSHIREDSAIASKLSLDGFLQHFGISNGVSLSRIESRIENLLSSFNIQVIDTPKASFLNYDLVQREKPSEPNQIIQHDASLLTHLNSTANTGFIFATWDRILTRIVESANRIYADTPSRVVDFMSMSRGSNIECECSYSLLDTLVFCDEKKASALANKIESIKSAEMAFELQQYTDAARKSSTEDLSSEDIVQSFFADHIVT